MTDEIILELIIIVYMNIFVINGHNYNPFAQGRLNRALFNKIIEVLTPGNSLLTTTIEDGYEIQEEIEKFRGSDIVIYQMPIYWFSFPHFTKKYIDEVYLYNVFFTSSEKYGHGGLMKGKKYMFSLTWNATYDAFYKTSGFMDGRGVDEFIIAMHKIQEYCGFERLPTFSCLNVVKAPNIEQYLKDLEVHLCKYILNV